MKKQKKKKGSVILKNEKKRFIFTFFVCAISVKGGEKENVERGEAFLTSSSVFLPYIFS